MRKGINYLRKIKSNKTVVTCIIFLFQLRAYKETIGPLKEVAYWTPEKFNVRRKNRNFAPSGGQHDDPLGLSVERSDSKISDAELRELFGDEKNSEIGSDNFDPGKNPFRRNNYSRPRVSYL